MSGPPTGRLTSIARGHATLRSPWPKKRSGNPGGFGTDVLARGVTPDGAQDQEVVTHPFREGLTTMVSATMPVQIAA
jgi:hypothetical protein